MVQAAMLVHQTAASSWCENRMRYECWRHSICWVCNLKSTCGMQERDPKRYSMATEEHALKIRRPWHCQSELSRLSTENISRSGEQPKAIIRARKDHVNSTRLAPGSSGFSCQILPDNRGHDKGDRKDQPACEPPVGYTSSGPNVHRSRTARQPTGAQC